MNTIEILALANESQVKADRLEKLLGKTVEELFELRAEIKLLKGNVK